MMRSRQSDKCYEEFGITSENYEEFIGNADVVQWFYNSEFLEGIQSDFRWQKGQKITWIINFLYLKVRRR